MGEEDAIDVVQQQETMTPCSSRQGLIMRQPYGPAGMYYPLRREHKTHIDPEDD
jgi:hypothetical protein